MLPKLDNSQGDLEERSRSSNELDWPLYSYSQSQTWDRCEEAWNLAYRQGWKIKRDSFALSVGSLVHEGADIYYGNDCSVEALDSWIADIVDQATENEIEEVSRAVYILHQYVRRFASVEDRGYRPISTEMHVYAPFKTKKGRNYWIQGYIDLLMKIDKRFEIWDHKTTGTGFWHLVEFQMDPQTLIYCALVKKQGVYSPSGTVLNQLNTFPYKNLKATSVEKLFQRLSIPRTDVEIKNCIRAFSKLVDENIERYEQARKTLGRGCKRCQFHEICSLDQKGVATLPILKKKFEKKDPTKVELEVVHK